MQLEFYTKKPWQYTIARTQAQKDEYNCGVHICAIGAALLQEKCLTDITPSKYRRKIRNIIQRHFNKIHNGNSPSEGGLCLTGYPGILGWERSTDLPLSSDGLKSNNLGRVSALTDQALQASCAYSSPSAEISTTHYTAGDNDNTEELVRKYRNCNLSTTAMCIPHELVETKTKRLTSLTTILTNECFGRHVVAKNPYNKGLR